MNQNQWRLFRNRERQVNNYINLEVFERGDPQAQEPKFSGQSRTVDKNFLFVDFIFHIENA